MNHFTAGWLPIKYHKFHDAKDVKKGRFSRFLFGRFPLIHLLNSLIRPIGYIGGIKKRLIAAIMHLRIFLNDFWDNIYLVINTATKADKRAKYELAQVDLLAKIAKSLGVPENEINKPLELIR